MYYNLLNGTFAETFHTTTLNWTDADITVLLDGNVVGQVASGSGSDSGGVLRHYIIMAVHAALVILIRLLLLHLSQIASPCLMQPLGMDFDRETMPGWMQLPDPTSLPDRPFEVDYVRTYKKL